MLLVLAVWLIYAADRALDAWSGMGTGWSITSTMIGGIAAIGGLGFLLDRGLNTYPVFILVGLVLGIAVACRYTYGEFRKSLDD